MSQNPASPSEQPPIVVAERGRWLADARRVLFLFVAWRSVLFAFDALGESMTRPNPVDQMQGATWRAFPNAYFLDGWARWDSGWYHLVVAEGYSFNRHRQSTAAFFPGFPFATRALTMVVGNHWVAGLLVSNLATLGALFYLLRIGRRALGDEAAERAVIYALAWPASFYLSAFYSEGLFLLATTASFAYYLDQKYARSGLWGALATMTRPTGVALLLAYALGLSWNLITRRTQFRPGMFWLLLIPGGLLVFMLILHVKFGDPIAFVAAHGAWGRSTAAPHVALVSAFRTIDWTFPRFNMNTIQFLEVVSAAVFLVLPLLLLGKADISLPIYSLLLILVPLSTGSVKSMLRLEVVAFPAFLALARLGANRDVDRLILFGSALFLGFLNLQFANWYWVG